MRIALVQLGTDFPSMETQAAALRALRPDEFLVEEGATLTTARHMRERLERLVAGDNLCVAGLECLRRDPGEAALLAAGLLQRGITLEIRTPSGDWLRIEPGDAAGVLLDMLAGLQRARRGSYIAPVQKAVRETAEMLTDEQEEEIRRLSRSGLTPRRIGLIFRRSPRAIQAVLARDLGGEDRQGRRIS